MSFMNDASSGYKKYKNEQGISQEELFDQLSNVPVSFAGAPRMDVIAKKDSIVYDLPESRYVVYVQADKKSIIIAKTLAPNQSAGKYVLKELGIAALSNAQGKDTAVADRGVDEVAKLIEQLNQTGSITENRAGSAAVSGNGVKLYMKQKVVSIKDKYSICTMDQEPKYWVVGNLIGLKFHVNDAQDNEVMTIKKKMVALLPEYEVLQGNKKIAHIKKKLKLTRAEIVGKVNGKELTIKGDMTGYHFNISLDGVDVGAVDTERLTWGDCYSIEVFDPSLQDLVVTIAVICDNTLKNKDD